MGSDERSKADLERADCWRLEQRVGRSTEWSDLKNTRTDAETEAEELADDAADELCSRAGDAVGAAEALDPASGGDGAA